MTIAVLGGSFDPPHLGHHWVVKQILEKRKDIEKILLIPVNKHQWKDVLASEEDRLDMLSEFVQPSIELSDIEIKRPGISYTEDTLRELKKKYSKIFWIVGSDILNEYKKWDKKDEILNLATLLVFPRDPYLLPEVLPHGFESLKNKDLITSNISSSAIRNRIAQNLPIKNFVTPRVEELIRSKGLYR